MKLNTYYLEICTSTMEAARQIAATDNGTFTVRTDEQTAGRGRLGRLWTAARGENLLFTYSFPVESIAAIPSALSLRAGLALARTISDLCPALAPETRVKWPNDVLLDGKKCAGILVESDSSRVYLGMGVNVRQRDFSGAPNGTSLVLALEKSACNYQSIVPPPDVLMDKIISHISKIIIEDDKTWLSELNTLLYRWGEAVRFRTGGPDSAEILDGTIAGIQGDGALLLRDAAGNERAYYTGELLFFR